MTDHPQPPARHPRPDDPGANPPLKIAIYRRQGMRMTPGVMTLDARSLSFVTEQQVVFHVPLGDVEATFTMVATLVIRLRSTAQKYVFVVGAYAGGHAPDFTPRQLAEVEHALGAATADDYRRGVAGYAYGTAGGHIAGAAGAAAGVAASFVGRGLGAYRMARAQHSSFHLSRNWAIALQNYGIPVTFKAHRFWSFQWRAGLVAVLGIGVLIWVLMLILS